jgi:hypothetical protein
MTKARSKPAAAKKETERSPLSAFVHHQVTALEEAGKAVASLFPKDFRTHTGKALDEGKAGFTALFDGVVDSIECGLDKLRSSSKADDSEKPKVKVEVD